MRVPMLRSGVWLLLLAGVLTGCAADREALLIGTWQATPLFGTIAAVRLKDDAPSASASDAVRAGLLLAATALEVRKDKTFTLASFGNIMEGAWTFDKESGELLLNGATARPLPGAQTMQPGTWVAYMDPDNLRLRLHMGGPQVAAQAQKSGGPLADGIPLKKDDQ